MSALRAMLTYAVFAAIATGCSPARFANRDRIAVGEVAMGPRAGVIFVDAMKQAGPWSSKDPLVLDRAGFVRFLAPNQVAETVVYPRGSYPAGDYTLLYAGKGQFDFSRAGAAVVARAPGRIVLRIVPRATGIRLRLTATDPSDPIHDIRLILPGFARTYASEPFHPLFLQGLRPFNVLRFKDWMHADTFVSTAVWPDRPTTTRATQIAPAGVAPEYMVALANATGANPWFTLPVGATDMYIYQFAALVHHTLDPRLQATFEYGDEAWKSGTPGNAYAATAGRNLHLAADRNAAARHWYALRSTQMSALVERAFGADARRASAVAGEAVAAAATRPLSRDALERWRGSAPSHAGYMALFSMPPAAASAHADGTSARYSAGLSAQRRRRMTHDANESPPDYRI